MSRTKEPDDADMPPRIVDVQRPFLRLRIWHTPADMLAFLGIEETDGSPVVKAMEPMTLDELTTAWLAYRKGQPA
jgi:hypothetical protein